MNYQDVVVLHRKWKEAKVNSILQTRRVHQTTSRQNENWSVFDFVLLIDRLCA